jgi:hypothetical protein
MKRHLFSFILLVLSIPLLAQVEKKVIIEHFTNTRCGICAGRNPAFFQTLEDYPQVLHVAYHPSAPYPDCIFHQHNPTANDDRTNFYGIYGGTPRVVIQGEVVPVQSPLIKPEQIDDKLGQTSNYKMVLTVTALTNDTFKATLEITKVSGGNQAESFDVAVGLAEETINYNAPNGENVHHNVFRRWLIKQTVSLSQEGEMQTLEKEYDIHPEWVVDEIYAYSIMQDPTSMEVLQTASSQESPAFIGNTTVEEIRDLFYPNPASTVINIHQDYRERFRQAELYSFVGNRIAVFETAARMDISDLPDGMYFIVATDKQNRRFTSRLIVNH